MMDKTKRLNDEATQRLQSGDEITQRLSDSLRMISPLADLQQGYEIIENKYIVEKLLSKQGGEADVYLCQTNDKAKRPVVVKLYRMNVKPKTGILDKIKGIQHPDIVNVLNYGTWDGRFYEVMEYAEGGCLTDNMPFSEAQLTETVIPEVVNALKFIHSKQIIHRDLKPNNLFYRDKKKSDVVLGDFGISSIIEDSALTSIMTKGSRTPAYTAPEIFSGKVSKSGESDYYSLGMTLIHLLTGMNPFAGTSDEARIMAIHTSEEVPLPDCSSRFRILLRGLLIKERTKRWGYDQIQRWLKGEDVPVYHEDVSLFRQAIPPFKFKTGLEANSVEQLAGLMESDLPTARRHVGQGTISAWLKPFDQARAVEIGEIEKAATNLEAAVVEVIYILEPGRPYRLTSAHSAHTPEQLANAIDRDATTWQTGKDQLYNCQIFAWLKRTGFQHLVDSWNSLDESHKSDPDEGLETLLHILDPQLGKPILDLNRTKLIFGWIEPGNKKSLSLKIGNAGRGYLTGSLNFEKTIDGVSVSNHTFKGKRGEKTEINFSVDTTGLRPSRKKRTTICIESNAQKPVETIALSYRVAFPILKTLGTCLLWSIPGILIPLIYQLANNYFTHRELLNFAPAIPLALLGIVFFGLFVGLWKSANKYQVGYLKFFAFLFLLLFLFGSYNNFQSKLNLPEVSLGETPRWIKQNAITFWATIQSKIGLKKSDTVNRIEGMDGKTGIVIAPQGASVRIAPDKNAQRIGTVAYQQKVTVLDKTSSWFKIKFGYQGTVGYVYEELISVPGWQGKTTNEILPVKAATDETEPLNQPSKYYVMFESNPSGAVLFINDRRIGETPLMTTTENTPINIRLELDGYQVYSKTTDLNLEGINKQKIDLIPKN